MTQNMIFIILLKACSFHHLSNTLDEDEGKILNNLFLNISVGNDLNHSMISEKLQFL